MKRFLIKIPFGLFFSLAVFSCLVVFIFSCSSEKKDTQGEDEEIKIDSSETIARIDTMRLEPTVFSTNIVSNGKIRAGEFADLAFRTPDLVEQVYVHNGQHVQKGQKLAKLDTYKLNKTLQQQESDIAQAKLELQDVLIGQGYDPEKTEGVPAEIMRLARIRSGLDKAEAGYQTTLRELDDATLTAPFSGVVANVKVQKHSMSPTSEPAMRIINDGAMTIEFPVLDSEIPLIKLGDEVDVTPFSGTEVYKGRISEINPRVEENGQINLKASLNKSTGLIDGLNARVKISRSLDKSLVVPKKAVVLRTGRQVVFTWDNGKAMWNYVTTGAENLDSYVIEDGLKPGQIVIVSGNENLAHEAPVEITE